MNDGQTWAEFMAKIYFKPWLHGSVFFIGLAFGYFVHEIRPKKLSNVKSFIDLLFINLLLIIQIYFPKSFLRLSLFRFGF